MACVGETTLVAQSEMRVGEVRARDGSDDDIPSVKRARLGDGPSQADEGCAPEDRVPGKLVLKRYGIRAFVLKQLANQGRISRTKVNNEYVYNHHDLMRLAGWESDETLQPEAYWLPEGTWPWMVGMRGSGAAKPEVALMRRKLRDSRCFARAIRDGVRPITALTIQYTYGIMPETLDRWRERGRLVCVGDKWTGGYDPRAIKYYAGLAQTDKERERCMIGEEDRVTSTRNSERGGGVAADVLSIPELVVCVMEQVDSGETLENMRLVNRQWATLARRTAGARLWKPWTCVLCAECDTGANPDFYVMLIPCKFCTDQTYMCDDCAGACAVYVTGGSYWSSYSQRIDRCSACADEHVGSSVVSDTDEADDEGAA